MVELKISRAVHKTPGRFAIRFIKLGSSRLRGNFSKIKIGRACRLSGCVSSSGARTMYFVEDAAYVRGLPAEVEFASKNQSTEASHGKTVIERQEYAGDRRCAGSRICRIRFVGVAARSSALH